MSIPSNLHGSGYFKDANGPVNESQQQASVDKTKAVSTNKVDIQNELSNIVADSKRIRGKIQDAKFNKLASIAGLAVFIPLGLMCYAFSVASKRDRLDQAADLVVTMRQMKNSGMYKGDKAAEKLLDERIAKLEHRIMRATRSYVKSAGIMMGIAKDTPASGSGWGVFSRSYDKIINQAEERQKARIELHEKTVVEAAMQGYELETMDIAILTAPKSKEFDEKLAKAKEIGVEQIELRLQQAALDRKKQT